MEKRSYIMHFMLTFHLTTEFQYLLQQYLMVHLFALIFCEKSTHTASDLF